MIMDFTRHDLDETDPVFLAHDAAAVTAARIADWNTAYGWGDHSVSGYLTSYTETDPVFIAHAAYAVTASGIGNWNIAYGWGNHASGGYAASGHDHAGVYEPADAAIVKSNVAETITSLWNMNGGIKATGTLKLQPLADGDASLFSSADVGDADDGRRLIVWRNAPEGNDWIRQFVTAGRVCYLQPSNDFYLKGPGYVKIEAGNHMYLDLGDNAGAQKLRVRDSDKVEVFAVNSNGNVTLSGTVDGRGVAADGTKLDGIESGAAADQTGAEIKAAYEGESDTNEFSDTEQTKLASIATGAEVNTKEFFISAGEAILSSNASYDTPNDTYQVSLADGVTFARCFFTFRLPTEFSSMASGYPKVTFKQGTGGTGNYRIAFNGRAGGAGESMGASLDNIAEYTMAAPGATTIWEEDISSCFDGLSLAAGDYVGLQIQRDSDDSLDTFAGDLDVVGVVVKYS